MEKDPQSHIVLPKGFIGIRSAQLFLGVIILGMAAWLSSNVSASIDFPGSYGLALFTAIANLIIIVYGFVAVLSIQSIYNMWAWLALEIFMVVFWLCSMATLAAWRAAFNIPYYGPIYRRAIAAGGVHLSVLTGTTVLCAFEFILFIVSLALFSVQLHQYRMSKTPSSNPESHGMLAVPQPGTQNMAQQPQYQQPVPVQQYQQPQPQYQQPPQQYQQPPQAYQQAQPYQQPPQQVYQQPLQSDQEKMPVEHATPAQFQPQPYQGAGAYNHTITPVSSPPPPHQ